MSTKVTTRHITTNPNLGIIYFGDDSNEIFALSYICNSIAIGTVSTDGNLKDIHICDPASCSTSGSNLIYSAPNCVVNCPTCIHMGVCVSNCPENYACVNKVC